MYLLCGYNCVCIFHCQYLSHIYSSRTTANEKHFRIDSSFVWNVARSIVLPFNAPLNTFVTRISNWSDDREENRTEYDRACCILDLPRTRPAILKANLFSWKVNPFTLPSIEFIENVLGIESDCYVSMWEGNSECKGWNSLEKYSTIHAQCTTLSTPSVRVTIRRLRRKCFIWIVFFWSLIDHTVFPIFMSLIIILIYRVSLEVNDFVLFHWNNFLCD